jgi:hypothetical protein
MFTKAKEFFANKRGDMDMLGSIAIGLLGLVIIFSLVMTIGPKIDETRPTDLDADSDWNSTYNTDLVEPATLWSDNATFISLSAMVIIISVLMFYVFRMRSGGMGGAGGV